MADRIGTAISHAMQAIAAGKIHAGMMRVLDFLEVLSPGETTWKTLEALDYIEDSRRVAASLRNYFADPDSEGLTHFYFGLDDLNMPDGKGIEFGCGRRAKRFEKYPGDLPSQVLSRIFETCEENVAQYALGLSFLGLALRLAFEQIAPIYFMAGREGHVAFGFHDGELFTLGVAKDGRFTLDLPTAYLTPIQAPRSQREALATFWAGENATAGDWFLTAARCAALIEDPSERWQAIRVTLEKLSDHGRASDALPFLALFFDQGYQHLKQDARVDLHVLAATLRSKVGNHEASQAQLARAREQAAKIQDEWWRKHAEMSIARCAANFNGKAEGLSAGEDHSEPIDETTRNLLASIVPDSTRGETPLAFAERKLRDIEAEEPACGNYHHAALEVEIAISPLLKGGFKTEAASLMPRVLAIFNSFEMEEGGHIPSTVHRTLAKLLATAGLHNEATVRLHRAHKCAAAENTASSRSAAFSNLATTCAKLGEWDLALDAARYAGGPDRRRRATGGILFRAGRWQELRGLWNSLTDPADASGLAVTLAWATDKGDGDAWEDD